MIMYRLLCNVLSAAKIMQHKIIAQNNLFKANQIADGKILRYVIHETFAMNGLLSAFQVCPIPYGALYILDTSVVIGVVTYNVRGENRIIFRFHQIN